MPQTLLAPRFLGIHKVKSISWFCFLLSLCLLPCLFLIMALTLLFICCRIFLFLRNNYRIFFSAFFTSLYSNLFQVPQTVKLQEHCNNFSLSTVLALFDINLALEVLDVRSNVRNKLAFLRDLEKMVALAPYWDLQSWCGHSLNER